MYVTPVEYRNFPLTKMNCRSEGFPRTRMTKGPVRAIVEGDLFQSARSSSFFFLLSSFFFSHPESCLEIVFRKSDVFKGGTGMAPRGEK